MKWEFVPLWNQSLEQGEERKVEPRQHIWASELGGAYIDRYLRMKGVEPSNPPNPRSLRKFEAGNIWEWIVGFVLRRAGIVRDAQQRVTHQYPGLLEVSGRPDFEAGGIPDYEKAAAEIASIGLPPFITRATENIVAHFKEEYPDGLDPLILEIKSASLQMFELYERNMRGNSIHELQAFHYLISKGMPEAHLIYICKDDARMLEFPIFRTGGSELEKFIAPDLEEKYRKDIEKMTFYLKNDERPPLEAPIVFDEESLRFSGNYKMGYSNYLTMLYGFKNQFEFDGLYKKRVAQWNRVITRIAEGKTATAKNTDVMREISGLFPNIEQIIEKVKLRQ